MNHTHAIKELFARNDALTALCLPTTRCPGDGVGLAMMSPVW
jgi:hypothetical protein